MSGLIALNRELSRYNVLRDNVTNTASGLNKSFDSLEVAATKIGDYYTIDNVRADSNQLMDFRVQIEQKRGYLLGSVIPAIDREIARIKKEIKRLEDKD